MTILCDVIKKTEGMCHGDRYSLYISNRGTGVRELVANTTWEVTVPQEMLRLAAGRSAVVTVSCCRVSYPAIVVTAAVPAPHPGLIADLGVQCQLGADGGSMETTNGQPGSMRHLFAADMGHSPFLLTTWAGTVTYPEHTLTGVPVGPFSVASVPGTIQFSRTWVYDDAEWVSIPLLPDTGIAYVAFALTFEFM